MGKLVAASPLGVVAVVVGPGRGGGVAAGSIGAGSGGTLAAGGPRR